MPGKLSAYQSARVAGMKAAQAEHIRLTTPMHGRVAVFDAIEDARIWLFLQPMRTLYGAYERHGDAAGIIINSLHPLSLQRFTAAHEYGHHVLGHEASVDDEERIFRGGQQSMQEVAAQAFAGEFLMPIQLVNYTLRSMGLSGRYPATTPTQIYQLGLELGVSYSAVITQLVGQRKLPTQAGRRLRQVPPRDIKAGLVGERPADPWADVWLLGEAQEGRHIVPRLRDEIHVRLPETPSTGYVWDLVDFPDGVAEVVADRFETIEGNEQIGAAGVRHVWLRVLASGSGRLRLELRRPWQPATTPVRTFQATLQALAPLTGDVTEGVTSNQKNGVIAEFQANAA